MGFWQQLNRTYFGSIQNTLPPYVLQSIARQQDNSERLISWVLLFIICTFGVLYAVSPKTFNETAKIVPVPWVLGAYFIFSLIRLFLSYRCSLPRWFLILSAFVDITLLTKLIFSFHIQYNQIPAFYLKAPTLLYLFIFIALRTLRFEAKYVLMTGLFAAGYWLLLIAYALYFSPEGTVTRDYVLYMTSNHLLIGGEIDKVISILLVTFVLTLAVIRGQRLLVQAVLDAQSTKELSKFFDPEVVNHIIASGQDLKPGFGELREVAIMHCDIREFTLLSANSSPSEVMQLLADYQSRVIEVVKTYQGNVDKFLGDGILISFNAIKQEAQYAANALKAALDVQKSMEVWNLERQKIGLPNIRVAVCVTTGVAMLGIVGDLKRMEYTIIGDPVNLVAKLDKQARVEKAQILTTASALNLAKSQGYTTTGLEQLKARTVVLGVENPLDIVVIC